MQWSYRGRVFSNSPFFHFHSIQSNTINVLFNIWIDSTHAFWSHWIVFRVNEIEIIEDVTTFCIFDDVNVLLVLSLITLMSKRTIWKLKCVFSFPFDHFFVFIYFLLVFSLWQTDNLFILRVLILNPIGTAA